ncbi:alpha/beta-hydrolase [Aureobasidium pullulans]|nr:alpha/beta-hydrolase [Aureobasidium pullulans]
MGKRILTSCLGLLVLGRCVFATPSTTQLGSVTILAADDLITTNNNKTSAALLLGTPLTLASALTACESLHENLWSLSLLPFTAGLNNSLAYEVFSGRVASSQLFWTGQSQSQPSSSKYAGSPSHSKPPHQPPQCQAIDVNGDTHHVSCKERLPVLCSQTASASNITYADNSPPYQISQAVGFQTLVGYRDFLTFRFMGVRFAAEPERFTYSSIYEGTGTNDALEPAPECLTLPNNGSTDCLFLNIWTTSLPRPGAKQNLKPVMVYIYGGGFTTGSASNPTNDGGNLAARGDVVVVDIAYRLSTLGFLALDDGVHNGNYFLSDQIAALEWVQKHIERFGGDPSRVTIFGESAGAESVNALMASPKGKGLFHGAILQSNYYQPYVPLVTAVNQSTTPILNLVGCRDAADQLACLQAYNATELLGLKTVFNYPVVDGTYLVSEFIDLNSTTDITNRVPVIMGVNRDEEGVLGTVYPTTNLTTGIDDIAAANHLNASDIPASDLFPLGTSDNNNATLNVFNTTTRISTDVSFRCSNQFEAYAGVKDGVLPNIWFYEFNRTYQDPAYNPNLVCAAPVTPSHPYGDPSQEYFKCHAGDLANTFGNVARVGFPDRDGLDAKFGQLITDYWTSFARNLDPNPDMAYLKVRGYWNTIEQIEKSGAWEKVDVEQPMMMELQWNSVMMPFRDIEQCAVLGYPLDFLTR